MANVPVLAWRTAVDGGNVANVPLEPGTIIVSLNGTDQLGNHVKAKYLIIDNTGINAIVTVRYNTFVYTVSPYTRKKFPILTRQDYITLTVASGTPLADFFDFDPGIPDDVNDVAVQGGSGGLPSTFAVWGALELATDIVRSGADLTATRNANTGASWPNFQTDLSKTTGKYYHEITVLASTSIVGFGKDTTTVGDVWPGSVLGTVGYLSGSGIWLDAANAVPGMPSFAAGDTLRLAIDLTAKRLWISKVGNYWNNDVAADPVTNVNGVDISANITGAIKPMGAINGVGAAQVANFGGSVFLGSLPSGYGYWGV